MSNPSNRKTSNPENLPAHTITDAGRKKGEARDCTVRAFATACAVSYDRAHEAAKAQGRKDGCGFRMVGGNAVQVVAALGCSARLVRRSGSLGGLLRDYPNGRLIVRVTRHAFAVIDGVVHDLMPQAAARRVKHAWLIE